MAVASDVVEPMGHPSERYVPGGDEEFIAYTSVGERNGMRSAGSMPNRLEKEDLTSQPACSDPTARCPIEAHVPLRHRSKPETNQHTPDSGSHLGISAGALTPLEDPNEMAASCAALTRDLLAHLSAGT